MPKTVPDKLLFLPKFYEGYGIQDLWVLHLAEMSRFVVQHVRNMDSLGKRVKILLSYQVLEAEISGDYISRPQTTKPPYVTNTILNHLAEGLKELKTVLCLNHWVPPKQYVTIMELIMSATNDVEQLLKLNMCQMMVKAHYLHNILSLDGKAILPPALTCEAQGSSCKWPTSTTNSSWWDLW